MSRFNIKDKLKASKRFKVAACLLVAVATATALILPASTVSTKTYCGHESHEHSDSCYTVEKTLICGQEESEGHQHTDECYETVRELVCTEDHEHTDECYQEEKVLICDKEESEGHQHTDECYKEEKTLTCGLKEHEHTLSCYSNPDADLETEEEWEESFEDVDLDDEDVPYNVKAIEIAKTQLGYEESTENYDVADDGETKKGITRYGQWYGDDYGDWCAMFCSFCIRYAGIEKEDFPIHSNCNEWIKELKETEDELNEEIEKKNKDKDEDSKIDKVKLYHKYSSSYTPKSGDLVFYDWDDDGVADHIGFLYRVKDEDGESVIAAAGKEDEDINEDLSWKEDKEDLTLVTIEGNHNGQVEYVERAAESEYILGFGEVPEACESDKYSKQYVGKDYKVTATYSDEADLPQGTRLVVEEILDGSDDYDKYYNKALEEYNDGLGKNKEAVIKFARFFDISFVYDGEEIEPEADVKIKITYDDTVEITGKEEAKTVHFDGKKVEVLDTKTSSVGDEAKKDKDAVDTFRFKSDSFSVYGTTVALTGASNVLAATATTTNTYYQEVTSITSGEEYIILSSDGNYAISNTGATGTSVTKTAATVSGYDNCYTVEGISDANLWTFTGSGTSFTIESGSNYVYLGGDDFISTSSRTLSVNYVSSQGKWTISRTRNSNVYYATSSNGTFSRTSTTSYVQILKKITVEEESGGGSVSYDYDGTETEKPDYPAPMETSAEITGTDKYTEDEKITVSWASDASTSKIEALFSGVEADDGKVLTDKSVVYGDDDYGAIETYEDYTFGVTLSALGQEYQITENDEVVVPVDVVFILDVSGSMENNNTSEGITRTQAVVNAVNTAMTKIMKANTENRVGIVIYSSGGSTLLTLDHYTPATAGKYLEYSDGDIYTTTNLQGTKVGTVTRTNGEANGFTQGHGTYTQYGIALGAGLLTSNTDTTYTQTLFKNTDNEKEVTVQRQPVMILLSDGDPTHCTSNYSDVLSGPHYGSGVYTNNDSQANNKGIHGYYTILSANYYKNAVTNHYKTNKSVDTEYQKNSSMYTIGMGIYASGYDDFSGQSRTGDHYKRAVLNPTADNVEALTNTSAKNYSTTSHMLKSLLSSSYSGSTVTVASTSSYKTALGDTTGKNVPVIANPYTSYSYADGAYFGNLGTDELTDIFNEIIQGTMQITEYGLLLQESTKCEIHDTIGDGMEVKGEPVLRYNGVNYTYSYKNTIAGFTGNKYYNTLEQYIYDYIVSDGHGGTVDLNNVVVQKYYQVNKSSPYYGKQEIRFLIPADVIPVYTPGEEGYADWYYQSLPIRLIYKVGLTDESKETIADLDQSQTFTVNTNRWVNGNNWTDLTDEENMTGNSITDERVAYSFMYPTSSNPYYRNKTDASAAGYHDYSTAKVGTNAANVSGTATTSIDSKYRVVTNDSSGTKSETTTIFSALGNNGTLTFTSSSISLTVNKVWVGVAEDNQTDIEVNLYRKSENETETCVDTVTLTKEGNWKYKFNNLPVTDSKGADYVYRAEEVTGGQYTIEYSTEAATYDSSIKAITPITITNTAAEYELPITGGNGTLPFTLGGILLLVCAGAFGFRRYIRGGDTG